MQKGMRKVVLLTTVIITALLLTSVVSAGWFSKDKIPIPNVLRDVFVYDSNNIIDEETEEKINTILVQLEEKTGAEVAIVTVDSLLDMEIEDYSYELANTLGIGKEDEDNGVLLLISRPDKRVRLEIGKGLEGCLNDSKCGRILDDYFVPYRDNDEYSKAAFETIQAIVSVVAKEYNVTIGAVDNTIAEDIEAKEAEESKNDLITMLIIIALIIGLCLCDQLFLGGVLLDAALSSSSSSSGGSSRSGGSFGGGSFGGGGASR